MIGKDRERSWCQGPRRPELGYASSGALSGALRQHLQRSHQALLGSNDSSPRRVLEELHGTYQKAVSKASESWLRSRLPSCMAEGE